MTEARKPDLRGEREAAVKTIACGNAGRSRRPRCEYSCAYLLPYAHTGLRVRLAPGIPHALYGAKRSAKLGRLASRDRKSAFDKHARATFPAVITRESG